MKNKKYIEESLKHIWHPCSQMKHHEKIPLIPVKNAKGSWLFDFDDKKFISWLKTYN